MRYTNAAMMYTKAAQCGLLFYLQVHNDNKKN